MWARPKVKSGDYFTWDHFPSILSRARWLKPNPKSSVLRLYGQEVKLFKLGRMPARVIIDRNGVARYVHYGHSMSDIPPNDKLSELLPELDPEGTEEKDRDEVLP